MRKAPAQDSQRPDQRNYLSTPVISALTLKVFGVLTTILGTACTLALASKPQQDLKPTANTQIAVKPLKDALLLAFGNGFAERRCGVSASLYPVDSLVDTNTLLVPNQLPNQKRQQLLNKPWGLQDDVRQQQFATLKLVTDTVGELTGGSDPSLRVRGEGLSAPPSLLGNPARGLGFPNSPTTSITELVPQATPSSQISIGMGTSSELALLSVVAWNLGQPLQNNQNRAVAEVISQAQLPPEQSAEPGVETRLEHNQQQSTSQGRAVQLTLSDIVILALQNNRSLKNAYLERIAERQDLAVAEGKFLPNFTPIVSVSIGQFGSDKITNNGGIGAGATVSVKVPTGGELSFTWAVNGQTPDLNGFGIDPNGDIFEPNLQLRFNQPLLRGAGINLNRASIDIARLTEQVNILNLKSTLIDTITNAIFAYRNLLQAQEQLKIEQQSLELAQQILEVNRALIEAGKRAPVDIVQSQTAVANRQVSLLTAQNNLEATKLALIDLLDIEENVNIVAAESPIAKPMLLDSNKLKQLAFKNRPDYLRAQLTQKTSQLELLLAEDDKRWDLNLITSLNNTINSNSDVRAGLVLSREFGDLTKEQRFVRSRVNLLQAENTLKDLNDSIKIQVTDRIRDVNLRFAQVERARQATVLSERQLDIEREKQRLGRGSGIFEIVRLQNDLVSARNAELEATIEYLNALTRLDQTLGTTLETWQVTLDRQ